MKKADFYYLVIAAMLIIHSVLINCA